MPKPLVNEKPPIQYKCTIHGWMTGYVRIFDHPYYAVTDANGNFEIKNAPVGKFRIVYWHENGVRGGEGPVRGSDRHQGAGHRSEEGGVRRRSEELTPKQAG